MCEKAAMLRVVDLTEMKNKWREKTGVRLLAYAASEMRHRFNGARRLSLGE